MVQTEAIRALADAALRPAGLSVWDVEATGDLVRVLVDRAGGVDLDALGVASAAVSELLDEHGELVPDGAYHLEVSSPGVERNLRTPEHFACCVGSTVAVKTSVAVGGARRLKGVLSAAGPEGIELRADDDPAGDPLRIPYDRLERVRTVLDWGPAPKGNPPSHRRPTGAPDAPVTADHPTKDVSR